jgi:hypothetical protein
LTVHCKNISFLEAWPFSFVTGPAKCHNVVLKLHVACHAVVLGKCTISGIPQQHGVSFCVHNHGQDSCSQQQTTLIQSCEHDCIGCDEATVNNQLNGCLDTLGNKAAYGTTFCKKGLPCSALQHGILAKCLANCATCKIAATKTVLGDCMADRDRTRGGTRAVELLSTGCQTGAQCNTAQENMAAKCLQNCDGCDRKKVAAFVAACTIVGHGAAVTTIEDACSVRPPVQPGPPPRVICSSLQLQVMDRCRSNCAKCDVTSVATQLDDCYTSSGVLARDNTCVHFQQTPPSHLCSALQMALISHCKADCAGCKKSVVNTVLNNCTSVGVKQVAGATFCAHGGHCDQVQHRIVAQCMADCSKCDLILAKKSLKDCTTESLYDTNVQQRAVELLSSVCNTGQPCSPLQEAVVARCIKNCKKCEKLKDKTSTVLGTCTEAGRSAMSTIRATCAAPPSPPACSQLQQGVETQCTQHCAQCTRADVAVTMKTCVMPSGLPATAAISAQCGALVPPPPQTGPKKCTSVQQKVIADCKSNCLTCNTTDAANALLGCRLDTDTRPQQPGKTFCVVTVQSCTAAQNLQLAKCLSNCPKCNVAQTKAAMGTCRAEMDHVWLGVPAIDLIERECAHHTPCSPLQQAVAVKCTQNCKACDFTNVGVVLGMCDEKGHGAAVTFITDTCHNTDAHAPAVNSECTLLQSASMSQCQKSCQTCKVGQVRKMLGDCVMQNGQAAALQMCPGIQFQPTDGCSQLQERYIRSCSDDCMKCNVNDADKTLKQCKIGGVAQIAGNTFCKQGQACTARQHAVLTTCITNCATCNKAQTRATLGDCMAATDTVYGGVRAMQLMTTQCSTGVMCSDLQHKLIAQCVAKCGSCDRVAIATVVGSCTLSKHGTAASYIADSCDPKTPSGPPQCSKLQQAVVAQCRRNCKACDTTSAMKQVGDCMLPNKVAAKNDLCVHMHVIPDPTTVGVCTPLQMAVIRHCTNNCHKCDVKDMGVVLAKCTISGTPQAYGATFCSGASVGSG